MNREYFFAHPPRCIAGYAIALDDKFRALVQEFRLRSNVGFSMKCSCGCSLFSVRGTKEERAALLYGRVYIQCAECGQESLLFDPAHDGYDGELRQFSINYDGAKEKIYRCGGCEGSEFELGVLVEPEVNGEESLTYEQTQHLEDFFNSIAFFGICNKCSKGGWISSVECA